MTELKENTSVLVLPSLGSWCDLKDAAYSIFIAPRWLPNTWDENGTLLSSSNIISRQVAGIKILQ